MQTRVLGALCALIVAFVPPAFGAAFTDVATTAGVAINAVRGAAWGDFDQDQCLDLFLTRDTQSALLKNNCDGTFTDVSLIAGISGPANGWTAAWADFDADGDLDVYVASSSEANLLYQNNGDGTFSEIGAAAGVADPRGTTGASWVDYDGDGDLDLFVANRFSSVPFPDVTDRLYQNNGDGTFTDVAASAGVGGPSDRLSFMGLWFDFDRNGTLDLYVSVDFGDDVLYSNNGDGTFTDVSVSAGVAEPQHGMGVAVGDLNADGCLDVAISNNTQGDTDPTHGPSGLYINNCDGTLSNVPLERGLLDRGDEGNCCVEWGLNFVDWDNDMDVDLSVVAGGMLSGGEPNVLYETDCGGDFCSLTDVTAKTGTGNGGAAFGSAWADYDNDGDLDWFVANVMGPSALFRNDAAVGHYLKVKLAGLGGNLDGVGARVEVEAGGRTQVRVIQAGLSYSSSEELAAFFGLGVKDTADVVRVLWPSGIITEVTDVAADQTIEVSEVPGAITGNVMGTTVNPSGLPEPGATVRIMYAATREIKAEALSDINGSYFVPDLTPGDYIFGVHKNGFRFGTTTATVIAGDTITVDVSLRTR